MTDLKLVKSTGQETLEQACVALDSANSLLQRLATLKEVGTAVLVEIITGPGHVLKIYVTSAHHLDEEEIGEYVMREIVRRATEAAAKNKGNDHA